MANFTYNSFTTKQGVLVGNGGPWTCTGFGSPCTQDASDNNYGSINATGTSGEVNLEADITLAETEFAGAISMSYTFKWQAAAAVHGGDPVGFIGWTYVGPMDEYPDLIFYNLADYTLAVHNGTFGYRPTSINLRITAEPPGFDGATVSIVYSGISFEIHDVVYGTTSTPGTLPATGSSLSSSTMTTATNSTEATVTATGIGMTVTKLVGVIVGSLMGAVLVLIAIALWHQRRRRRRMLHLEGASYDDEQNGTLPDFRMVNQGSLIPNPYREQAYSRPTTIVTNATPGEYGETGTSEIELVRPKRLRSRRREGERGRRTVRAPSPRPPSYSQLSPRLTTTFS